MCAHQTDIPSQAAEAEAARTCTLDLAVLMRLKNKSSALGGATAGVDEDVTYQEVRKAEEEEERHHRGRRVRHTGEPTLTSEVGPIKHGPPPELSHDDLRRMSAASPGSHWRVEKPGDISYGKLRDEHDRIVATARARSFALGIVFAHAFKQYCEQFFFQHPCFF